MALNRGRARRRRGWFITFEGCEGSGKSTQARRLASYLERLGFDVERTREPGGTVVSERVRRILLDPALQQMTDVTELFLYMASRAQLVEEVILPAVQRGRIVVCDRFLDATRAYQGCGGSVDRTDIEAAGKVATQGYDPDLTLLIDVDVRIGLRRARRGRADRIEAKTMAYHERVRKGYLNLARREPQRIRVIEGTGSPIEVQQRVREVVHECLNIPAD